MNMPLFARCSFAALIFLDISLAYISFKMFINGAISLFSLSESKLFAMAM